MSFINKFLIILLFLSLLIVPVSAVDDGVDNNMTIVSNDIVSTPIDGSESLGDYYYTYYFDASAKTDGSGTQSSPYKYLTSSRISGDARHVFASGTYQLDSGPSFFFYGSAAFEGNGADNTIIKYTGSDTFLTASSGNTISIKGLTIQGANFKVDGTLDLANSIIENAKGVSSDNYGNNYGGAVSMSSTLSSSAKIIAQNTIFRNNHAEYGGAIYASSGTVNLNNCKFIDNEATQFGGAIAILKGASATINNCEFKNDRSKYDAGGSVYIINSKATITNSNFTDSSSFYGPAVTGLNSTLTMDNIIAKNNNASYQGGAIYSLYGYLKVTSSTFDSNMAKNGGAIFADNLTTFYVKDSKFDNNVASEVGGAIFAYANIANIFSNPTFNQNRAKYEDDKYVCDIGNAIITSDDYLLMQYKSAYAGSLPSKFDLRNYNQVSAIRNQANSGNCWAYATMATLESCILKATGTEFDLSEGNLKNLAQYFSDYGWQYETNDGGFYRMSTGYLLSWLGPVLESQDLTDDNDVISPVMDSLMHVNNILFLQRSSYTDNNAIKEAIMKYGAVASEIYFVNSGAYYSPSTGGYYYNGGGDINHAIAIVGWDDTFSRYNFPSTPAGDGAWIIKNSYGNQWGVQNSGFGYVSYYDTSCAQINKPQNTFTFILNDTVKFDKNYQYDPAGWTDYFVTGKNTIYYKNTFTSTDDEYLSAFGTYFNASRTNWEAKIYVNDDLKLTQSGISGMGYYTINLKTPVSLRSGDKFTIELKISCNGYASFMISEHLKEYSASKAFYSKGVSYFSYDGKSWTDLSDYSIADSYGHKYSSQVACIKAYTVLNENASEQEEIAKDTSIEITEASSTHIIASVTAAGAVVNGGNVEFKVDGKSYVGDVINGKSQIDISINHGIHLIEANYTGNNKYNPSYTSKSITIKDSLNLKIISSDIVYGEDLTVNISLTNNDGEDVSLPVIISVNGNNYFVKNNLVISNLKPGNYTINANTGENSDYLSARDSCNVSVLKQKSVLKVHVEDVIYGDNATVIAEVSNINSGSISIKINSREYEIEIDDGVAILDISDLKVGNYQVSAEFEGNEYFLSSNNSTSFSVLKANPNLTAECGDIEEGQIAIVNITLKNDASGVVYININEKQYLAFISNGKANVKISDLNANAYSYTVEYGGNDYYNASKFTGVFNVTKKEVIPIENVTPQNDTNITPENDTNITQDNVTDESILVDVSDVVKYYGGSERLIVSVSNSNGDALENMTVNISINGVAYTRKTDSEGIASIGLNLNQGSYDIMVTCDNISRNAMVTIKDTVLANDLVKVYRNESQYYAQFLDSEGNLIKNNVVTFNINGVFYNRTTDENGIARLNINLNQGNYIITAYNPLSNQMASNNITVLPRIVENHDLVKYYRNDSQYVVRLVNDDGSYAKSGEIVKFNINGVFYERKTNDTGHVKLNINLAPGDYIITAEYGSFKISNNISVLPTLVGEDLVMTYHDGSKFKVNAFDNQGKPASNKKITFNINGVFYDRFTDSLGEALLNINLQSGEYIITSSYNELNISNKITIN